jgi:hypothetical protein
MNRFFVNLLRYGRLRAATYAPVLAFLSIAMLGCAQAPVAPPPSLVPEAPTRPSTPLGPPSTPLGQTSQPAAPGAGPLAPLAWLEGCWQGNVNQREFREQWLPLRGGTMIGAGQQVSQGRMQDYEFLRLDARGDGVYFTQFSGDRKETSFKLVSTTTDDKDTIFMFANTVDAFPARLIYRRGTDGWLYQTIEGLLNGSEKKVIYPMRRIGCESGELILK